MIYTEDIADRLKARAGEKWRPANGIEASLFQAAACHTCTKWDDGQCEIADLTFWYDLTDPGYPAQWQIGPEGQPICTARVDQTGGAA